jgi:Dolichyl-phosphate-mannose-protein mannosyltransferase
MPSFSRQGRVASSGSERYRKAQALRSKVFPVLGMLAALAAYSFGASNGAVQTWYIDEVVYDRYAFNLAQSFLQGAAVKFEVVHPSGYSLILTIVYGAWYLIGRLTGEFSGLQDLLVRIAVERGDFVVLGRWTSAAFAAAALPGTYLTGRRLFSRDVGLIAALSLATSYPVVFYSHIAANLTMLVCISAWALYFGTRIWQNGSTAAYFAAGVVVGIGVGTKYYPILLFASVGLAHLFRIVEIPDGNGWRAALRGAWKPIGALVAATVGAVIFFPVPFFARDQWLASLRDTVGTFYTGGNPLANAARLLVGTAPWFERTTAEPVSWWSNSLLCLTIPTLLCMCVALVWGILRFPRATLFLASPVLLLFGYQAIRGGLSLGVRQLYFGLPGMFLLLAAALRDAVSRVRARDEEAARRVFVLAAVLLLAQPAWWAARYLFLASRPSTVELARQWMRGVVPPEGVLLVDSMAAPYGETVGWRSGEGVATAGLGGAKSLVKDARRKAAPPFEVRYLAWTDARKELSDAEASGHSVFVALTGDFSMGCYDEGTIPAWGNLNARRAPGRRGYLRDLFAGSEIIKEFRPRELSALGPTVIVMKARERM